MGIEESKLTYKRLKPKLAAVNDEILQIIENEQPEIRDVAEPYIRRGGKRIRPLLVLLSAEATNAFTDATLNFCVIVELIHTASLFHDDVLDEAMMRRGQKSINLRFGNQISILAGDYLYAKALSLALENEHGLQNLINQTVLKMVYGELKQATFQYRLDQTVIDYYSIIEGKTAALIELSCALGAYPSKNDHWSIIMSTYGRSIGLAYQIIDDLLDWISDEKTTGKQRYQDIRDGRITLPLSLLIKKLDKKQTNQLITKFENRTALSDQFLDSLYEQMIYYGIHENIREEAAGIAQKGIKALENLPESQSKADLINFAYTIIKRKF